MGKFCQLQTTITEYNIITWEFDMLLVDELIILCSWLWVEKPPAAAAIGWWCRVSWQNWSFGQKISKSSLFCMMSVVLLDLEGKFPSKSLYSVFWIVAALQVCFLQMLLKRKWCAQVWIKFQLVRFYFFLGSVWSSKQPSLNFFFLKQCLSVAWFVGTCQDDFAAWPSRCW